MLGNVWEWTGSPFTNRYKGMETHSAPLGSIGKRSVRGGSFGDVSSFTRAARRIGVWAKERANIVGFRLVRAPPTKTASKRTDRHSKTVARD